MITKVKSYQCDLCISQTFGDDWSTQFPRWVVMNNGKVVCPSCAETIYARRSKQSGDVDQGCAACAVTESTK